MATSNLDFNTKTPPHDLEAEQSLLGSILLNNKLLDEVADKIKSEYFYEPRHTAIFKMMLDNWAESSPSDIISVLNKVESSPHIKDLGDSKITKEFLLELISKSSLSNSTQSTTNIIKNKYLLRTIISSSDELKMLAMDSQQAPEDILDIAQKKLFEISLDNSDKNFVAINEILGETFERITELYHNKVEHRGVPTGFVDIDKLLGGLHKSDLIILAARPSMGKAQPIDTLIKTLDGWKEISKLKIGEKIASANGDDSVVQGMFPQGKKQVYKITFADGRYTYSCKEHLWEVNFRMWDKPKVLTTEQLIDKLSKKRYQNRLWIPFCNGKFGSNTNNFLTDPYLLGCLIGDGGLTHTTPVLSTKEEEILHNLKKVLPEGLNFVKTGKYDYRISQIIKRKSGFAGPTKNILTQDLKMLGLFGKTSNQKFIPETYLTADYDSRMKLLQGLMDTDGWVEKTGSARYSTVSEKLALNAQTLIRSLGGYCDIKTKSTSFTYNGIKKIGQLSYILNISGIDTTQIFTLKSKLARCKVKNRIKRLNIINITPSHQTETVCIKVSHPSQLYICNDYIVTHNTSLSIEITKRVALLAKTGVAYFSLEMSKEQLLDKLLATVSGIDSWKIRTGKFSEEPANNEFMRLGKAIGELDQAPIWIDDSGSLNILELRSKARRLKSRHDIGLIIIDYLQLMSGAGNRYGNNRVQEVSDISRGLKILAKELDIPIIALSQLSRSVEGRDDKRPMLSDLRESGSIEQDADIVMFVHREEMYNRETKKKGIADILISKHRNGSTGTVELAWVHRLATFDNLDHARVSGRVNE